MEGVFTDHFWNRVLIFENGHTFSPRLAAGVGIFDISYILGSFWSELKI